MYIVKKTYDDHSPEDYWIGKRTLDYEDLNLINQYPDTIKEFTKSTKLNLLKVNSQNDELDDDFDQEHSEQNQKEYKSYENNLLERNDYIQHDYHLSNESNFEFEKKYTQIQRENDHNNKNFNVIGTFNKHTKDHVSSNISPIHDIKPNKGKIMLNSISKPLIS